MPKDRYLKEIDQELNANVSVNYLTSSAVTLVDHDHSGDVGDGGRFAGIAALTDDDDDTYNASAAAILKTNATGGVRLDHLNVGNVTGAAEGQAFAAVGFQVGLGAAADLDLLKVNDDDATAKLWWDDSEESFALTNGLDVVGSLDATTVTGANVTSGNDPGHAHTTVPNHDHTGDAGDGGQHAVLAAHTVTGATLDVIGLSAVNTLAVLTPSSNPGAASKLLKSGADGALQLARLIVDGSVYIGDDSNSAMTRGLTINQGAADDEILALKSSDVAHGMTALAETDTYFNIRKWSADYGGPLLFSFSETHPGIAVIGYCGTESEVKNTAAIGALILQGGLRSGTGATTLSANNNILVIRNYGTTRFIFDADGDAHADVSWTTFDEQDDVVLLSALETEFARRKDPVKAQFGEWLDEHRHALQVTKVVNFYDDGPRAMVNFSRLAMLHTGAIRQLAQRLEQAERALLGAGIALPETI